MKQGEQFSNRWGIILASLGMAIGAGNLWRFPRLAGQYGGSFIILWILFLFIWSIPILLAEFSIGKKQKKGVIGAYAGAVGKNYTWIGFFIAACTLMITFYYTVVTAWALQYLGLSIQNILSEGSIFAPSLTEGNPFETRWQHIANSNPGTVALYILTVVLASFSLYRGIQKGLERANRILIPALFVLLILIIFISIGMESGIQGFEYMFYIETDHFASPQVWIEALSQSAWSTGAGWGLLMTISSYSRQGEDVTLNTFIGAFGNNTASLMAGMAILPAVFALAPNESTAIEYLQSGNQALTFTIIPKLFSTVNFGDYLSVVFFATFFLAAFSSFLPMMEMFIRVLGDLGISRYKSTLRAALICSIFALPSALSLDIFSNQDWVWGIGLIISGLFIVFAAIKNGVRKFKENFIDRDSDFKIPTPYFSICMYLNIFLAIVLIYWWLSQGYSTHPWIDESGYWNAFSVYSNATVVTQWMIVLLLGIILNRFLYKKFVLSP